MDIRSWIRVVSALAAVVAVFLATNLARAEPTTGLWPNVSVPPADPRAEPSNDAALIIGIDRYDALPRVLGAADNARDWEKYFLFGRRTPPDRVSLLTDQNATVESISARAKELAAKVPDGGTLFVIFIGHGAPGQGGQKGLLLGADVRPSDSSFGARSLSYDQLETIVQTGRQSRTIMVLDACFSGIDSGGRTLLPNVQPVIAASLVASSKTTVFSAGTAAEYAGALPGSQRPALSYLVLGALRGWADNDADGVVTVDEVQAYASLVMRSLPNNHEQHPQLITDAAAEPLEKVAKEKAPDLAAIRSKLDTWRPPVEQKPEPKLRVAVGCQSTEPRSPEDGLDVFIDDSPVVAAPVGGEKVWDDKEKRNVVRHIEYAITEGRHHVTVRIAGCDTSDAYIDANGTYGADLSGVLRSTEWHGPAQHPNWGRIGLALWMPRSFGGRFLYYDRGDDGGGQRLFGPFGSGPAYHGLAYSVSATGIFAQPSLTFRWWTLGFDIGYAEGSVTRTSNPAVMTPELDRQTANGDVHWFRTGLRAGARFPFSYAAFSLGVGTGYDNIVVNKLAEGLRSRDTQDIYGSAWANLDVAYFCDWPVFVGFDAQAHALNYKDVGTLSILIGAAFQPNSACRVDRATNYTLAQTGGGR